MWTNFHQRSLLLFVLAGLLLASHVGDQQHSAKRIKQSINQGTVPTRTPTPAEASPTNPPPVSPPGTEEPVPTETSTGQIPTDPTATSIILAETPEGGYLATAENCGVPPTVQALDTVNVRAGPGVDYEQVGRLVYLEVRPIVARATYANWWQIMLPGGDFGWVIDSAVSVTGNTSVVPEVLAPSINGVTPTRGVTWSPTLESGCQPLPTFTPLSTSTSTGSNVTITVQQTEMEASLTVTTITREVELTATPETNSTEVPRPIDTPLTVSATPDSSTPSPTPAAIGQEEQDDSDDGGSSMLLLVGVGLIFLGVLIYIANKIIS